jgi:hypothetical protein
MKHLVRIIMKRYFLLGMDVWAEEEYKTIEIDSEVL